MSSPRAVVIPFGVPVEGRGLGLGLAALMHTCVHLDGSGVAIAQLHGRRNDEPEGTPPSPVEAFVPPAAWKDIAGRGETPPVVTGAFEPPLDGHGTIQLLAFDARDGKERARIDAALDGAHAGASLVGAFEQLGARLGGEIGALGHVRELEWDALESVLRAERCALHDPLKGGPHDRLAAMQHLGRAIGDAPLARYPAERLASIALETAMGATLDVRLAAAAARALARAVEDAPNSVELVEALAALEVRLGHARDAERRINAALALAPERTRLYALLSQALRAQGNLDAALAAVESAHAGAGADPLLTTERGVVLAARGDFAGAAAAWREALAGDPVHAAAFTNLAALALRDGDAATGQWLVDAALASTRAHPDVLRRAVQIALATEGEGLARASRVAGLCGRLLEMIPNDGWASLALAKSQAVLGDVGGAPGSSSRPRSRPRRPRRRRRGSPSTIPPCTRRCSACSRPRRRRPWRSWATWRRARDAWRRCMRRGRRGWRRPWPSDGAAGGRRRAVRWRWRSRWPRARRWRTSRWRRRCSSWTTPPAPWSTRTARWPSRASRPA